MTFRFLYSGIIFLFVVFSINFYLIYPKTRVSIDGSNEVLEIKFPRREENLYYWRNILSSSMHGFPLSRDPRAFEIPYLQGCWAERVKH
jgi:hypothetical protein